MTKHIAQGIVACVMLSTAAYAADDIAVAAGESVQDAVDRAAPGSTVRLAAGNFVGRINVNKPLTIEGAGWDKTTLTLDPAVSAEKAAVVTVQAAKGVVLRGVKITDPARPDGTLALVRVTDAACKIDACALVGGRTHGVMADGGSAVAVDSTLIAALWWTGVAVQSPAKVHVTNSEIRNNYYSGVVTHAEGTVIETSRIGGSAWHGVRYDDCSPIIRNNLIAANARCGIYASGVTHGLIQNNTFQNNEMDGVSCWFYAADYLEGNRFVDNKREAVSFSGKASPTLRRNSFGGSPTHITSGPVSGRRGEPAIGDPVPTIEANTFGPAEHDWTHQGQPRDLPPGNTKADAPPAPPLPESKWPIQPEEAAMIPKTDTRNFADWQRPEWIVKSR